MRLAYGISSNHSSCCLERCPSTCPPVLCSLIVTSVLFCFRDTLTMKTKKPVPEARAKDWNDYKWWKARPIEAPGCFSLDVDQKTKLCQTCSSIFCGARELRKEYAHHRSWTRLTRSADAGCRLCKTFQNLFVPGEPATIRGSTHYTGEYGSPVFFEIREFLGRLRKATSFEIPMAWKHMEDIKRLKIKCYIAPTQGLDLYHLGTSLFIHDVTLLPPLGM
jgi:hypothetical protein